MKEKLQNSGSSIKIMSGVKDVNEGGERLQTINFEFKSYAAVRALVYQARALKNQYLIEQFMRLKRKEQEANSAKNKKESKCLLNEVKYIFYV